MARETGGERAATVEDHIRGRPAGRGAAATREIGRALPRRGAGPSIVPTPGDDQSSDEDRLRPADGFHEGLLGVTMVGTLRGRVDAREGAAGSMVWQAAAPLNGTPARPPTPPPASPRQDKSR